jgi:asparagine synthase (glutamine-hydrolysing)
VEGFDEPYAHPSAVALYLAARHARGEVQIMLGGESADDLFAGNRTLQASKILEYYNRLPGWLSRRAIPWAVDGLPMAYSQMSFSYRAKRFAEAAGMTPEQADAVWKQVIRREHKPALHGPALRALPERPAALRSQPHLDRTRELAPLNRLIYAEMQMSLVDDVLYKHDRVPAACGLDNFGPYTDRRVAEFAFRLPVNEKIRGLRTKYLLRKMIEKRVPREAAYQKKLPFNAPSSEWLSGSLREFLRDTLSDGTLRRQGVLDPGGVAGMMGDHLERRADNGPALWSLLALTLWLNAAGR